MLSSAVGFSTFEFIKLLRSSNDGTHFDYTQKQVMVDTPGTINSLKFDLCDPTNSVDCAGRYITLFTSSMELMIYNYDLERALNAIFTLSDTHTRSTG